MDKAQKALLKRKKECDYEEDCPRCFNCANILRVTTETASSRPRYKCGLHKFYVKTFAVCNDWEDKLGNKLDAG